MHAGLGVVVRQHLAERAQRCIKVLNITIASHGSESTPSDVAHLAPRARDTASRRARQTSSHGTTPSSSKSGSAAYCAKTGRFGLAKLGGAHADGVNGRFRGRRGISAAGFGSPAPEKGACGGRCRLSPISKFSLRTPHDPPCPEHRSITEILVSGTKRIISASLLSNVLRACVTGDMERYSAIEWRQTAYQSALAGDLDDIFGDIEGCQR